MAVDICILLSEENDRLTDTVAKQAARIEQLEKALRDIEGGPMCSSGTMRLIARAALEGKP